MSFFNLGAGDYCVVLGTIALSQILYHKTFAVKQGLSPDKKRTLAKDWKELVKPPDKVPGCGAKMQNAIKKADGRQLAYKKQEYSLFFKLPAEIRNQIYEQLLVAEEPIIPDRQLVGSRMRDYKRMGNVYRPPKGLDASILRACRAICYEGSPILYSQNLFRFRRTYDITWFHNDDLEYGRAWAFDRQDEDFWPKKDDGSAVGLRKLTIKGLRDEPLLEQLKSLVAPEGELILQP